MSGAGIVPATNSLGRQLSGPPNFQVPDVPMPIVQEPNVLAGKCPRRKKSKRQSSETPNVSRQMSKRGSAGAICLPSMGNPTLNLHNTTLQLM